MNRVHRFNLWKIVLLLQVVHGAANNLSVSSSINATTTVQITVPTNTTATEPTDATATEPTDATAPEPTDATATEPTDTATEPTNATATEPTNATATEPTDVTATEPTDATATEPTDTATEPTNATATEPTNATTVLPKLGENCTQTCGSHSSGCEQGVCKCLKDFYESTAGCVSNKNLSPQNVTIKDIGLTSVNITWNLATEINTSYIIKWGDLNRTVTDTSFTVPDLKPGSIYNISVYGEYNGAVVQAFTELVRTLLEPPSNIQIVSVTTGEVNVNWSSVANVTKYKVTCLKLTENWSTAVSSEIIETTNATCSELDPGMLFEITVLSIKENFKPSQLSSIKGITNPMKPSHFSASVLNSNSTNAIQLNWTYADNSGHTGFKLLQTPAEGSLNDSLQSNDRSKTQFVATGLVPGRSYRFTIKLISSRDIYTSNSEPVSDNATTYPAPVSNLTRLHLSAYEIQLRWIQSGELDGYDITLSPPNTKPPKPVRNPRDDSTYEMNITSLSPYKDYTLSFVTNRRQLNSSVVLYEFKTSEAEPSEVKEFNVNTYNDTSLILTWREPDPANGLITDYTISYWPISNPAGKKNKTVDGGEFNSTIIGLKAFTEYSVSIVASTSAGSGPPVYQNITTSEAVPGPPTSFTVLVTGARQMNVSWAKPEKRNGQITNYTIQYNSTVGSINTSYHTKLEDLNKVIENLKPCTVYSLRIAASTSVGRGDFTEWKKGTTQVNSDPKPVEDLEPSIGSKENCINVTWRRPSEEYCNLTYSVTIHNARQDKLPKLPSPVTVTDPSHEFCDLYYYWDYNFTVLVKTIEGSSDNRTSNVIRTGETAPSEVREFNVTTITASSFELRWLEPDPANGVITNYTISYWPINNSMDRKTKTISGEILTTEISGLKAFTEYNISIVANTSAGSGPPVYQNSLTSEAAPTKVRGFDVTKIAASSFELTWLEPDPANGLITNYTISYWPISNSMERKTKTISGRILTFEISGLKAFTEYSVSIVANTSAGSGPPVYQNITTSEAVPGPPTSFTVIVTGARQMNVSWAKPETPNGKIMNYTIEYSSTVGSINTSYHTMLEDLNKVIENLKPCTVYSLRIAASTSVGRGDFTEWKNETTQVNSDPKPVNGLEPNRGSNENCINVTWRRPSEEYCNLTYSVTIHNARQDKLPKLPSPVTVTDEWYEFCDLYYYWDYKVAVIVKTTKGSSDNRTSNVFRTGETVPGPVRNLKFQKNCEICYDSVSVLWEAPELYLRNGIIFEYTISYKVIDVVNNKNHVLTNRTNGEKYNHSITGIQPGFNYSFTVLANNHAGSGELRSEKIYLKAGPPKFTLTPSEVAKRLRSLPNDTVDETKQIRISISKDLFKSDYGTVKYIALLVGNKSLSPENGTFDSLDSATKDLSKKKWNDFTRGFTHIYQPFESMDWDKDDKRKKREANAVYYVIGKNDACKVEINSYCNGPLKPDTKYWIAVRGFTANGYRDTPSVEFKTSPSFPIVSVVVSVVVVVVVIVVIVAVVLIWRRRRTPKQPKPGKQNGKSKPLPVDDGQDNPGCRTGSIHELPELSEPRPVPVDQFVKKVEKMRRDADLLFLQEYELLEHASPKHHPTSAALDPANYRLKNRYTNILPFDHSRVVIGPYLEEDETETDYINANWIPGNKSDYEFIACQGPTNKTATNDDTVKDFWRMIWEKDVNTIVMVTRLREQRAGGGEVVKCAMYWPQDLEPVDYGEIIVKLDSESFVEDYVIRILELSQPNNEPDLPSGGTGNVRTVVQFHLMSWMDFQAMNPSSLLNFIQVIKRHIASIPKAPLVVHCSAGVGRTGSFICIERILDQINNGAKTISVYHTLMELRNSRKHMVQGLKQYKLIHDVIAAAIEGGWVTNKYLKPDNNNRKSRNIANETELTAV